MYASKLKFRYKRSVFYLFGTSSNTICAPDGSADGGAGGGWFIGGGGSRGCARQGAVAFTFFGGLPAPAAVGGRLDAGTFLLGGTRALPGACVAAGLVCSVGRGGTKRARAAAVVLSSWALGFAAWGGGTTEAAAAEGME
jgi:hypothetical protein